MSALRKNKDIEEKRKKHAYIASQRPEVREKARKRMLELWKNGNVRRSEFSPTNTRKVLDTRTNKVYVSVADVARYEGVKYGTAYGWLLGKNKEKQHYRFADEHIRSAGRR